MGELLIVFCYRALHWVTIEMLCVPVDEEIPVVSDSVVKAITGKSQVVYFSEGPRYHGGRDPVRFSDK